MRSKGESTNSMVIFYDIPSTLEPKQWSPNTLKTRTLLNFLQVQYQTQWVEYPQIKQVLCQLGVNPHLFKPHYTLPAVTINDGDSRITIMGSEAIAAYFLDNSERLYQVGILRTPSVRDLLFHRVTPQDVTDFNDYVSEQLREFTIELVTPYNYDILCKDDSKRYFIKTRRDYMGLDLLSLRGLPDKQRQWDKLINFVNHDLLVQKRLLYGTEYLFGDDISYADLVLFARLAWIHKVTSAAPLKVTGELLQNKDLKVWYTKCSFYA